MRTSLVAQSSVGVRLRSVVHTVKLAVKVSDVCGVHICIPLVFRCQ